MDVARARRNDRSMVPTQRAGEDSRPGVMTSGLTAPGVMAPAAPRPPRPPRPRGSFKRGLRRALREPFTRRNLRECRYAGVGLLVAIPLFAFTAVAFAVSLALSVSFAGLPLLALSLRAARRLGDELPPPGEPGAGAGGRVARAGPAAGRHARSTRRRRCGRSRASWAGSGRA